MSSLLTNSSAMNALSTLRNINQNLSTTQDRIGTGLKVQSAKDNAAYFSISESMKGDSAMYSAIDEGLTLTKNSLAAAEKGAKSFQDLAQEFTSRMAFSQNGTKEVAAPTQGEFKELVKQMETIIAQSTFNGDDLVGASGAIASTDSAKMEGTAGAWTFTNAGTDRYTAAEVAAADKAGADAADALTTAAGALADETALAGVTDTGEQAAHLKAINAARKEAGTAPMASFSATAADYTADDLAAVNAAILVDEKKAASDTAIADKLATFTATETKTSREAVTGISRAGGDFATTKITVNMVDLKAMASGFKALAEAATDENLASGDFKSVALKASNDLLNSAISATTNLGQSGKSIDNQQEFLKKLTDTLDNGVGAMVDADMEEEAARLQALQVQQQLATQSLSIANQGPQNLLSLFR